MCISLKGIPHHGLLKTALFYIKFGGPKGLHADIGSLKRFRISSIRLAKKFLFESGPVGISSDIASKSGSFLLVLVKVREAKKVSEKCLPVVGYIQLGYSILHSLALQFTRRANITYLYMRYSV